MTLTRRLFTQSLLAGTAAGLAAPAIAQGKTSLKMILNWRYQGPQAWFFLAQDRGYFADAGIEMIIDQGNGSGAAVGAVASGSYDIGFGDINIKPLPYCSETSPAMEEDAYGKCVCKDDSAGNKLNYDANSK